jgi:hypothetical protein
MVKVIFTRKDGTAEKVIDVLPNSKLGEDREAVQMLLGLPVNPPYKFFLERTQKELKDNLTFEKAGIQENDKLILFSPTDKKILQPEPTSATSRASNQINQPRFSQAILYTIVMFAISFLAPTIYYKVFNSGNYWNSLINDIWKDHNLQLKKDWENIWNNPFSL